jgi:hypothetical protein
MMKTLACKLFLMTGLAVSACSAQAAECLEIGGVAIPNFFSEGKGEPVIISATLMGSVTNASGKILAQRITDTGLEMDMEHYFGRADGGAIYTKDVGVLTEVPDRPGRYMIEITYDVQEGRGRGTLEDFGGTFSSYGLVDLRDPEDLQGLVRYSGELCK